MTDENLIAGVHQFVAREIAPAASQVDRDRAFPDGHWRKLCDFGLAGLTLPTGSGGLAADTGTLLAAAEAVAGGCASTAWALLAHLTVCSGIAALGTAEQKARYLPQLASGQRMGGTLAGTETGGGSNPGSIKTTATPQDDGWELNGSKFFITQAGAGDVYLVLARTDTAPGPQSLSCFIVDKDDPGLRFGEREATMGLHGVQVREVFFDHCRLPADRLLGQVGGAMALLGAVSSVAVLGVSAAALGIAQAALDTTLAYLKQRTVLGQPLASHPAVQAQVAQLVQEATGARAWLAWGQQQMAQGIQGPPVPLWLTKVSVTEAASRVVDKCLGLHGAVGYSQALPLERMHRDLRAFSIHWGNNDVLMDMAGKAALA
ncbi:MAG: acyl-CoA dehydrogenase family protein [Ottowia sp.]|nr:acyl-CoA dehydrogenase family protein [Ottowia sp.]